MFADMSATRGSSQAKTSNAARESADREINVSMYGTQVGIQKTGVTTTCQEYIPDEATNCCYR